MGVRHVSWLKYLRTQAMFLCVIMILVPVSLLGTLSYMKAKRLVERQLQEDNFRLVQEARDLYIDAYFRKMEEDTEALARRVDLLRFREDESFREALFRDWELFRYVNPHVEYVYVGTEDGRLLVSPHYTPPQGFRITRRPWYRAAMESKDRVAWTVPYEEAKTGVLHVSAVRYLPAPDGHPAGVFVTDISLAELTRLLRNLVAGKNLSLWLVTDRRDVLVHLSPETGETPELSRSWANMLRASRQGSFLWEASGRRWFVYYVTTAGPGWKLITAMPVGEVGLDGSAAHRGGHHGHARGGSGSEGRSHQAYHGVRGRGFGPARGPGGVRCHASLSDRTCPGPGFPNGTYQSGGS